MLSTFIVEAEDLDLGVPLLALLVALMAVQGEIPRSVGILDNTHLLTGSTISTLPSQ